MSYLHCPTCRCAYNVALRAACPSCGVQPGAPADPTEDVVAAAEQLARAVARATAAELAAAEARLDARSSQLALPSGSANHAAARWSPAPAILRAVRAALTPASPVVPSGSRAHQALLTTVVLALLTRIAAPPRSKRAWVASRTRALLARV